MRFCARVKRAEVEPRASGVLSVWVICRGARARALLSAVLDSQIQTDGPPEVARPTATQGPKYVDPGSELRSRKNTTSSVLVDMYMASAVTMYQSDAAAGSHMFHLPSSVNA